MTVLFNLRITWEGIMKTCKSLFLERAETLTIPLLIVGISKDIKS